MPFLCLLVKIAKIKPREIKYQEGTRSPGARETWDWGWSCVDDHTDDNQTSPKKMNLRPFKHRVYFDQINLSNVDDLDGWILKDYIQVKKKSEFVIVCSRFHVLH